MALPQSMPLGDMLDLVILRLNSTSRESELKTVEPFLRSLTPDATTEPDVAEKITEAKLLLEKTRLRILGPAEENEDDSDLSVPKVELINEDSDTSADSAGFTFGDPVTFNPERLAAVARNFIAKVKDPKFASVLSITLLKQVILLFITQIIFSCNIRISFSSV